MAELFVRNSLNSNKVVKFNTSIQQYVPKGKEGDIKWVVVVGTLEPDRDGNKIPPVFIYKTPDINLDNEIAKAISSMSELIDWGHFEEDRYAPYIQFYSPSGDNVPIYSKVLVSIKDKLPSSGIDLSELTVIFNNGEVDFDITNECVISGDPYEFLIRWEPPVKK